MPRQPKATDLPGMDGPGVGLPKHKDLDALGDELSSIGAKKAKLATKYGDVERRLLELMVDKGITRYVFGDQEMKINPGKSHVKIRTIKTDSDPIGGNEDLENEDD